MPSRCFFYKKQHNTHMCACTQRHTYSLYQVIFSFHTHTHMHTDTHTHTHTHTCTHTHTPTHTHTHTHARLQTLMQKHSPDTHFFTHTQARTHAQTQKRHTHTLASSCI